MFFHRRLVHSVDFSATLTHCFATTEVLTVVCPADVYISPVPCRSIHYLSVCRAANRRHCDDWPRELRLRETSDTTGGVIVVVANAVRLVLGNVSKRRAFCDLSSTARACPVPCTADRSETCVRQSDSDSAFTEHRSPLLIPTFVQAPYDVDSGGNPSDVYSNVNQSSSSPVSTDDLCFREQHCRVDPVGGSDVKLMTSTHQNELSEDCNEDFEHSMLAPRAVDNCCRINGGARSACGRHQGKRHFVKSIVYEGFECRRFIRSNISLCTDYVNVTSRSPDTTVKGIKFKGRGSRTCSKSQPINSENCKPLSTIGRGTFPKRETISSRNGSGHQLLFQKTIDRPKSARLPTTGTACQLFCSGASRVLLSLGSDGKTRPKSGSFVGQLHRAVNTVDSGENCSAHPNDLYRSAGRLSNSKSALPAPVSDRVSDSVSKLARFASPTHGSVASARSQTASSDANVAVRPVVDWTMPATCPLFAEGPQTDGLPVSGTPVTADPMASDVPQCIAALSSSGSVPGTATAAAVRSGYAQSDGLLTSAVTSAGCNRGRMPSRREAESIDNSHISAQFVGAGRIVYRLPAIGHCGEERFYVAATTAELEKDMRSLLSVSAMRPKGRAALPNKSRCVHRGERRSSPLPAARCQGDVRWVSRCRRADSDSVDAYLTSSLAVLSLRARRPCAPVDSVLGICNVTCEDVCRTGQLSGMRDTVPIGKRCSRGCEDGSVVSEFSDVNSSNSLDSELTSSGYDPPFPSLCNIFHSVIGLPENGIRHSEEMFLASDKDFHLCDGVGHTDDSLSRCNVCRTSVSQIGHGDYYHCCVAQHDGTMSPADMPEDVCNDRQLINTFTSAAGSSNCKVLSKFTCSKNVTTTKPSDTLFACGRSTSTSELCNIDHDQKKEIFSESCGVLSNSDMNDRKNVTFLSHVVPDLSKQIGKPIEFRHLSVNVHDSEPLDDFFSKLLPEGMGNCQSFGKTPPILGEYVKTSIHGSMDTTAPDCNCISVSQTSDTTNAENKKDGRFTHYLKDFFNRSFKHSSSSSLHSSQDPSSTVCAGICKTSMSWQRVHKTEAGFVGTECPVIAVVSTECPIALESGINLQKSVLLRFLQSRINVNNRVIYSGLSGSSTLKSNCCGVASQRDVMTEEEWSDVVVRGGAKDASTLDAGKTSLCPKSCGPQCSHTHPVVEIRYRKASSQLMELQTSGSNTADGMPPVTLHRQDADGGGKSTEQPVGDVFLRAGLLPEAVRKHEGECQGVLVGEGPCYCEHDDSNGQQTLLKHLSAHNPVTSSDRYLPKQGRSHVSSVDWCDDSVKQSSLPECGLFRRSVRMAQANPNMLRCRRNAHSASHKNTAFLGFSQHNFHRLSPHGRSAVILNRKNPKTKANRSHVKAVSRVGGLWRSHAH